MTKTLRAALLIGSLVSGIGGCATPSSGFMPFKSEHRTALYRTCVSAQAKHSTFGSGMAVHEGCLRWARIQTR
jgi:hypothetical protein